MPKDIFKKVPVEVPNRSGFDMSHENLFSTKVGTLTPCLVDELLPNDTVNLGVSAQIQLPPMASDFYGRVRGKVEFFFVPFRLCYAGWQDFITKSFANPSESAIATILPTLTLTKPEVQDGEEDTFSWDPILGAGSLLDYLGYCPDYSDLLTTSLKINNILPIVAYGKIYDEWYRDSRIQTPLFSSMNDSRKLYPYNIPYLHPYTDSEAYLSGSDYFDGSDFLSLRQRNYPKDYFTSASTSPQSGSASVLKFDVDVDDEEGSFSIASLRAANSLQQFLERNNIAGFRYADQIKAQFGITPSDAAIQRPIYLGSLSIDVYNKSVFQGQEIDSDVASTRNPFNTVGAKYGSPLGVGDKNGIVENFTATEHGFLMGIFSLYPDVYYSGGVRRMHARRSYGDFAFPLLAGVGDQTIERFEVASNDKVALDFYLDPTNIPFGYTQRYSEYKFMNDEVHGLLREGESLDMFAVKRAFGAYTTIGSDFLEVSTDALDDVSAVSGDVSKFGCWVDMYFNYKKVSTLPAYSIPTLGDLKNTHTEFVDNGGQRL